jgi:hypothetical protein
MQSLVPRARAAREDADASARGRSATAALSCPEVVRTCADWSKPERAVRLFGFPELQEV